MTEALVTETTIYYVGPSAKKEVALSTSVHVLYSCYLRACATHRAPANVTKNREIWVLLVVKVHSRTVWLCAGLPSKEVSGIFFF